MMRITTDKYKGVTTIVLMLKPLKATGTDELKPRLLRELTNKIACILPIQKCSYLKIS